MFDLLSTAELTASAAIVVFFLSSILSNTVRQRALVAASLVGWFCLVLAAGATGAFTYPGIGTAGTGLAVVLPIAVLSLLVLGTARGRELVRRAPLPALVGVHSVRVLGLSFVLLYAAKRLPAPFAPVAGWGDIVVGLLAIPLALLLARGRGEIPKALILLWNVLGLVDLVAAVALGATSAPGPLQVFHGPPSSAIMATLPWILIPCFLVPALIFLHLCTFYRLRTMRAAERTKNLPTMRVATQSS
jgi:uncharacterized membrane protein